LTKNILILSLSIKETESISAKLKGNSFVSINLWHDLGNHVIDLNFFDGLIITGSDENLSANKSYLDIPDNVLTTIKEALSMDLPILGIKLGMQVINIALGGKHPKIITPINKEGDQKRKDVFVSPGSKLTTIIGYAGLMRIGVTSSYSISVSEKSDVLRASCYSVDNGFIEGFESDEHNWVLGIRFDPFEPHVPPNFKNLLESFLSAEKRI
tara:strand:+ start:9 stop:644 length:636 start_codon:yes stop_codon:yes gene_type:complete